MTWFLFTIIVGLGLYRLVVYARRVKNYYKVTGTIVGNEVKTVDDALMGKKYFYSPIVSFTDMHGHPQQLICGADNADRPLYKPGASIKLLVHPDDSTRFIMYDFVEGILIPIIWIIIGTAIPIIPMLFPETFKD
ncbi:DUF3592 domain-containing protein [Aridibaculum aurantiacum]|uniref:DUF3592 domain-containing protein n=1 Tax=Aridibaculum aurantiacum TaxID=2810307 RepID=UPI001A970F95|nr:DUF3592 domain-containing protein [Aridibaculum aurantiacum]